MTMIIHTTAPLAELAAFVGTRGNVTAGTAIKTGGPDCFAGWYEPADTPECLPNNIVTVDVLTDAQSIARDLLLAGHQVVVCGKDDAGNDVPIEDGELPIRYQMNHTH
jgi:hypothetical protein